MCVYVTCTVTALLELPFLTYGMKFPDSFWPLMVVAWRAGNTFNNAFLTWFILGQEGDDFTRGTRFCTASVPTYHFSGMAACTAAAAAGALKLSTSRLGCACSIFLLF